MLEGIKITFIETDPLKPDDRKLWKQIDGADLTDNIDKIKYPDSAKLAVPDGYSFGGWSIPEDKLKTDGPEKLAQDENNLIEDPKVNDGNPTLAIKALFVKAKLLQSGKREFNHNRRTAENSNFIGGEVQFLDIIGNKSYMSVPFRLFPVNGQMRADAGIR